MIKPPLPGTILTHKPTHTQVRVLSHIPPSPTRPTTFSLKVIQINPPHQTLTLPPSTLTQWLHTHHV